MPSSGHKSATVPVAYVFPAELESLAAKLGQHGIDVSRLQRSQEFKGESFRVTEIAKQNFVQNNHRNSRLLGSFESQSKTFSTGDYYVPMDNRLANLIFYLLEPEADDGLAYWNLFDDYLQSELENASMVDYPVFKVLAR